MNVLIWFVGIVSVLGIGGTIAAFIFVPTVAIPVAQSIVSAVIKCKPCLYALAVVALCAGSGWYGHHQAASACRAGELAAELAAKNADIEAAKHSAADAALRAKTIEDQASDRQQKDSDYIKQLESRPACALDGNDISGLRDKRRWRIPHITPGTK